MLNPPIGNDPPYDPRYSQFAPPPLAPAQSREPDKFSVVLDVIDIGSGAAIGAASAATGGYDPRYTQQQYQQSFAQPPYGPWSVPPTTSPYGTSGGYPPLKP